MKALTSLQLVYSCVFTCFRKHVVVLVVQVCVINSVIVNVPTYSLFDLYVTAL